MKILKSIIFSLALFTVTVPASADVFSKAHKYVGLHESSNRGTLREVTRVDPVRTPWCAAFVNGVLREAGLSGTRSNTARSFTKYKQATRTPQKGDIVVIRRKGGSGAHVGFFKGFVKRNGRNMVAVVGGNQSNKVSVAYYSTSKVISYRRVA